MARFTDMDVVGVLAFGLGFVFGSPSRLGWCLHLDGDSVMSANMGYVRGACREESGDGGWGQAGESSVVLLAIR